MPPRPNIMNARSALRLTSTAGLTVLVAAASIGLTSCSKPARLTGNFAGTCTFKGAYRGGGRADITWTRSCTLTLEDRSETEVAMRFDTGDAIECYGHATQEGSVGERKATFPKNDLTCRAKTLPAPGNIAVEQCTMPGTFEIAELGDKNDKKKSFVTVKTSLDVADKRACVVSYLEKVTVEAKLSPGGTDVKLEAFQDAGFAVTGPEEREPPFELPTARDGGPPVRRDGGPSPRDGGASPADAGVKPKK